MQVTANEKFCFFAREKREKARKILIHRWTQINTDNFKKLDIDLIIKICVYLWIIFLKFFASFRVFRGQNFLKYY